MKYAFITAALAAAATATVVNIDVEGTELQAENNRHHNSGRHSMNRHHHHHRGHDHRGRHEGRHWWTDLFGSNNSHRNNDRDHRRNGNGRSRSHSRGRPERYDLDELLEDLFRVNFECTRNNEWSKEQFEECYRRKTDDHGINDDLIERDDDIFMDEQNDRRDRNRNSRNRNGRNHRNHRDGRNGRWEDDLEAEQIVMDSGRHERNGRGRNGRRDNEYQCQIQLEDPMRREQVARQCCEEQQLGRYNPENQTCDIEGRDDKDEFQQCAYEQGALQAECWRENNGRNDE